MFRCIDSKTRIQRHTQIKKLFYLVALLFYVKLKGNLQITQQYFVVFHLIISQFGLIGKTYFKEINHGIKYNRSKQKSNFYIPCFDPIPSKPPFFLCIVLKIQKLLSNFSPRVFCTVNIPYKLDSAYILVISWKS
jgi:hypothetical protein